MHWPFAGTNTRAQCPVSMLLSVVMVSIAPSGSLNDCRRSSVLSAVVIMLLDRQLFQHIKGVHEWSLLSEDALHTLSTGATAQVPGTAGMQVRVHNLAVAVVTSELLQYRGTVCCNQVIRLSESSGNSAVRRAGACLYMNLGHYMQCPGYHTHHAHDHVCKTMNATRIAALHSSTLQTLESSLLNHITTAYNPIG